MQFAPSSAESEYEFVRLRIRQVMRDGSSFQRKQWESLLSWAEPLRQCDRLDGAPSERASNLILCLAMCALGDAYRELGFPIEAADVYRRSHQLRSASPAGDYYAKMALEFNLSDHYEPALATLTAQRSQIKNASIAMRSLGWILGLMTTPRAMFRFWKQTRQRPELMAELARRIHLLRDAEPSDAKE
jgi:tetratricopeptide (TPR) repeat protein